MKLTTDTLLLLIILGLLCFLIYDKVIKEPFYDEDENNNSLSQKCWNNSEDRINNDIDNWMHDRGSMRHNNQSMMDALREPCTDGIRISNKC